MISQAAALLASYYSFSLLLLLLSVGVKLQIKHATDTGDYAQLGSLAATIADLEQRRAAAEAKAKAAAEV